MYQLDNNKKLGHVASFLKRLTGWRLMKNPTRPNTKVIEKILITVVLICCCVPGTKLSSYTYCVSRQDWVDVG